MRATVSDAEYYAAVIEVLRGMRVALDELASKMLAFLLGEPAGVDAEITPSSFLVRFGPGPRRFSYVMEVAPAVVGYLLGDTAFPASRVLTRRIGPGVPPGTVGRFLLERHAERHVRIEALIGRIVIRLRRTEAELDAPFPDFVPESAMRFVPAARPCPRCGGRPDRFRVLGDGSYVCPLCHCSSSAAAPGP